MLAWPPSARLSSRNDGQFPRGLASPACSCEVATDAQDEGGANTTSPTKAGRLLGTHGRLRSGRFDDCPQSRPAELRLRAYQQGVPRRSHGAHLTLATTSTVIQRQWPNYPERACLFRSGRDRILRLPHIPCETPSPLVLPVPFASSSKPTAAVALCFFPSAYSRVPSNYLGLPHFYSLPRAWVPCSVVPPTSVVCFSRLLLILGNRAHIRLVPCDRLIRSRAATARRPAPHPSHHG